TVRVSTERGRRGLESVRVVAAVAWTEDACSPSRTTKRLRRQDRTILTDAKRNHASVLSWPGGGDQFHDRRRETFGRNCRDDPVIQNRRQLWLGVFNDQFAVSHVARQHSLRTKRSTGAAFRSGASVGRNRGRGRSDFGPRTRPGHEYPRGAVRR